MARKNEENENPNKATQSESAPLQNKGADKNETNEDYEEFFRAVELAGMAAVEPLYVGEKAAAKAFNVISQSVLDIKPMDAVEIKYAVQASALFFNGMRCLRRSEVADMIPQGEYYFNKAIKLLRLHNETIDALTRYRRGGEQKIVVQHNVVTNQAVVNYGEGVNTKNKGETPCSGSYAEQKQEPMAISHADNLPWPMADVDFMEVNPQERKQKRVGSE